MYLLKHYVSIAGRLHPPGEVVDSVPEWWLKVGAAEEIHLEEPAAPKAAPEIGAEGVVKKPKGGKRK